MAVAASGYAAIRMGLCGTSQELPPGCAFSELPQCLVPGAMLLHVPAPVLDVGPVGPTSRSLRLRTQRGPCGNLHHPPVKRGCWHLDMAPGGRPGAGPVCYLALAQHMPCVNFEAA